MMSSLERFWSKTVAGPGGCIDWVAGKDKDGYGQMSEKGKNYRAHRWIYERALGIDGRILMHSCDRPCCVALHHLSPGSNLLNRRDAKAKGRIARGSAVVNSVVDEAAVLEVRQRRENGEGLSSIARDLGISKSIASSVVFDGHWNHVPAGAVYHHKGSVCGPLAAILIRQMSIRGARGPDIQHAFGLSHAQANKIARGKSWTTALGDLERPLRLLVKEKRGEWVDR